MANKTKKREDEILSLIKERSDEVLEVADIGIALKRNWEETQDYIDLLLKSDRLCRTKAKGEYWYGTKQTTTRLKKMLDEVEGDKQ